MRTRTRLLALTFLLLAAVGCPGRHKPPMLPGIFEACDLEPAWEAITPDQPSGLLKVLDEGRRGED